MTHTSKGSFGLKEFWRKSRIPFPIGLNTVHTFGMEDWTIGKLKEIFLHCLFYRMITGKETST
jgi:hypothetical protein